MQWLRQPANYRSVWQSRDAGPPRALMTLAKGVMHPTPTYPALQLYLHEDWVSRATVLAIFRFVAARIARCIARTVPPYRAQRAVATAFAVASGPSRTNDALCVSCTVCIRAFAAVIACIYHGVFAVVVFTARACDALWRTTVVAVQV